MAKTSLIDMSDAPPPYQSLPELVRGRAIRHGQRTAVTFLGDDDAQSHLTYRELDELANRIAARLQDIGSTGDRALLLFPPGLDFLAGFLGCSYAGWIPVPTSYPKPGRAMPRLDAAAADCAPAAILTDAKTDQGIDPKRLGPASRQLRRVVIDREKLFTDQSSQRVAPLESDVALLQYTSGSTSDPKGVIVSQANLMANLEAIRQKFEIAWVADEETSAPCAVFWLPAFHDMGLIGGMLEPIYFGGRTILMSPSRFLQRPLNWLKAISDFRATISGAPSFAYQLCADRILPGQESGLDLSHWSLAFCGSEPVVWRSLDQFARRFEPIGFLADAFYPCYGLAEATLFVTGGDRASRPETIHVDQEALARGFVHPQGNRPSRTTRTLVSCGSALSPTQVVIVDPETCSSLPNDRVGEIWLSGESVARGYWGRDEESEQRFHAKLASQAANGSAPGQDFLLTGDLGFIHEGQLFVAGRMKETIILRGRNHYPVDVEMTVLERLGSAGGRAAAFAVQGPRSETLAVLVEIDRHLERDALPELVRSLRRSLIEQHEVDPGHLLLVRPATIPVTTSGKIRRSTCREMFMQGTISAIHRWDRGGGGESIPLPMPALPVDRNPADRDAVAEILTQWLRDWLVSRGGIPPEEVHAEKAFAEYGLDSLTSVELSGELEDWSGLAMSPDIALEHPSAADVASFLADQWLGRRAASTLSGG